MKTSKTKITRKIDRKTNPLLRKTLILIKKQKKDFWTRIADLLSRPIMPAVNIKKINHLSKKDEIIIIPGKVLAEGDLNHPVKIAAFSASEEALTKLKKSKSQFISIEELIKQNPKGTGVKILI